MRFEPTTTEPSNCSDDEACERDLPADLTELADQLHLDSVHLARLYPPLDGDDLNSSRKPAPAIEDGRKGGRQVTVVLSAGVSIVALLFVAVGFAVDSLTPERQPNDVATDQALTVERPEDGSTLPHPSVLLVTGPNRNEKMYAESEGVTETPHYINTGITSATHAGAEGTSIINVSGPQAEAYLDYIEMTSVRNVKLSF